MKTIVDRLVVVSLTVSEITVEGNSCTVEYEYGTEKGVLKNVFITGGTKRLFLEKSKPLYEQGRKYTSVNHAVGTDSYKNCPLTLIKTVGKKTGELMYTIKRVNELKDIQQISYTPNGNAITNRIFRTTGYGWRRYVDNYDNALKRFKANQKLVNS